MGAVSSAVIINTNKNENNNNNNDLQGSLGSVTSNVQMASSDQTRYDRGNLDEAKPFFL